jgi:3-oxoacyl-[acyl-carrier-protein] synthase II
VVTGVGLVTPLGTGVAKSWKNICAGKSGIGLITRFDTSDFQVKIAAEVRDFNVEDFLDRKTVKHFDLFVQYGLAAAMMAVEDSGVEINEANCGRVGVITGCGIGGLPAIEKYHQVCLEKGHKKLTPFFIPMVIPNMPSGHISIQIGSKGPNLALTTACAAGTHAVGEAYRHIQYGLCDVVVTGGAEAVICPLGVAGFSAMKALSANCPRAPGDSTAPNVFFPASSEILD